MLQPNYKENSKLISLEEIDAKTEELSRECDCGKPEYHQFMFSPQCHPGAPQYPFYLKGEMVFCCAVCMKPSVRIPIATINAKH